MVTLLAFVVLAGGGAYAASHLGKNSVGSKQLKRNAVTSPKVKNGSLSAKDLKAGTIPAGAASFQANGSANYDVLGTSLYGNTVVTLNVPPGNYLASSDVEVQTVNAVAGEVQCRLIDDGGSGTSSLTSRSQATPADGAPYNFGLAGLFSVDAGETLNLECSKSVAGSSSRILTANIVAVRVGSVSGTND